MSDFKEIIEGVEYSFPAFKFLSEENAKKLLENGNVHIPNIMDFRDEKKYGGLIFDPREGIAQLHLPSVGYRGMDCNFGDSNDGSPLTFQVDDAYIFCCASRFVTESLKWAIEDKKQKCVLITDVDKFVHRLTEYFSDDLSLVSAKNCRYIGRDFALNKVNRDHFLKDINEVLFIKPKAYVNQMESRLVWRTIDGSHSKNFFNANIPLNDLLIPINYRGKVENLDVDINYQPGVTVVTKTPHANVSYGGQSIAKVLSPIVHHAEGREYLGFLSDYEGYYNCSFGGDIPFMISPFGVILCSVETSKIVSIDILF